MRAVKAAEGAEKRGKRDGKSNINSESKGRGGEDHHGG